MKKITNFLPAFAVWAADDISILPTDRWGDLGNLTIQGVVSGLIRLVLVLVSLIFFAILIWGGVRWISSKGDKGEVENARNQITHALIGLAIVFVAWAIVKLIGTLFGIDILQLEIPTLQG